MKSSSLGTGGSDRRYRACARSSIFHLFGGGLVHEGYGERFANSRLVGLDEFIVNFSTQFVERGVARQAEHDDIVLVHGLDGYHRGVAAG